MVNVINADEQGSYDQVMQFLQEFFPEHRVYWTRRSDDHMWVEFRPK